MSKDLFLPVGEDHSNAGGSRFFRFQDLMANESSVREEQLVDSFHVELGSRVLASFWCSQWVPPTD